MMHGWGWSGFGPYSYGSYGIIGSLISFMFMIGLLIVVYIILKKIFIDNNNFSNISKRKEEKDILKILNEKLVKGEITEEEYIRKKELIIKNIVSSKIGSK
ncbi:hypothetical protein JCM30566_13560 [Marinitoga arctica]